jgi:hypothetical protein
MVTPSPVKGVAGVETTRRAGRKQAATMFHALLALSVHETDTQPPPGRVAAAPPILLELVPVPVFQEGRLDARRCEGLRIAVGGHGANDHLARLASAA